MLRKYFSFFILTSIIVGCGGGSSVTPVEIEVTLDSSAETVQYNDTYTLSWASNASQCYASGGWSGEKPTTGTETFTAKTKGPIGYGIECRKNNVFTQAQVVVTLEKEFIDSFDFKDEEERLFLVPNILEMLATTSITFNSPSSFRSPIKLYSAFNIVSTAITISITLI